jgi:hypothetical protein
VADDFGCHICGTCWWVGCENDADYSLDVALKRHGKPLYDGKVELCAGHTQLAHERNGRLDLNWLAIEQARSLAKAKA